MEGRRSGIVAVTLPKPDVLPQQNPRNQGSSCHFLALKLLALRLSYTPTTVQARYKQTQRVDLPFVLSKYSIYSKTLFPMHQPVSGRVRDGSASQ